MVKILIYAPIHFFFQEVYSFRFIIIIVGYAKRQELQWINDYLQSRQHETLYETLETVGRFDAPEFTDLLLGETDKISPEKDRRSSLRSSMSIPILNVKKKDDFTEIHVVERPKIEKALKSLINYTNAHVRV